MNNKIIVGRFGKPFGVKGWITVHSFTHPSENIVHFSPWFISPQQNDWAGADVREINIQEWRLHSKNIVVRLKDVINPEIARTYTNQFIAIDRVQLPPLSKSDDIYWVDLIGLTVINTANIELGKVDRLLATSANDVLVVIQKARSIQDGGQDIQDIQNVHDAKQTQVSRVNDSKSKEICATNKRLREQGSSGSRKKKRKPREFLIPYIKSVVLQVDFVAGKILVDWDENF